MMQYVQMRGGVVDTDSLAHYGVMGMKWGVRKDGMPQGYQGTGKERRQAKRDARAEKWGAKQRKRDAKVNASQTRKIEKAESKLAKAKSEGASDRKVAKLERKASDSKVHADIIKNRNEDLTTRNENYRRKSVGQRLLDMQTYNEYHNYDQATSRALDRAREKYGNDQIDRIERQDTAKAVAVAAGALAVAGALQVANDYYYRR